MIRLQIIERTGAMTHGCENNQRECSELFSVFLFRRRQFHSAVPK